ncbi:type 1 fimbrial protein [Salmonella enterica]|nr:type 1 fimbrial protein [Salmonella enterica]EKB5319534.1 type 1 fimbrial protein [Salmonella enterica]ELK9206963.1 type 1 fimbrial protein [Salmonella enterica]ELK9220059.1 type 1 fimbrial protein [Salmonella enterica]ELK9221585.1 type 1 fimbrial protein [Salmonella enterica]
MKKSMAGVLLLAGLMMSAGAMAASGDPVQGGSGTVTINVPIVTSTCSVSMPTEVNLDPVDKNSLTGGGKRVVKSKRMDITLSHCSGEVLQMSMRGHAVSPTSDIDGYFSSGDPDHALEYEILVPMSPEIPNGQSSSGASWYVYLNNTYPFTIYPGSDREIISPLILLTKVSQANITNLGSAVSGGFDYTFTYQ